MFVCRVAIMRCIKTLRSFPAIALFSSVVGAFAEEQPAESATSSAPPTPIASEGWISPGVAVAFFLLASFGGVGYYIWKTSEEMAAQVCGFTIHLFCLHAGSFVFAPFVPFSISCCSFEFVVGAGGLPCPSPVGFSLLFVGVAFLISGFCRWCLAVGSLSDFNRLLLFS